MIEEKLALISSTNASIDDSVTHLCHGISSVTMLINDGQQRLCDGRVCEHMGHGRRLDGPVDMGLSENESVPICSDLFKVLVEDGTSLKLNASLRVDPDQISRNSRVASQLDRHCASEAPIEAESPRNGHIVSLFLRALFVSEGGPDRSRTKVSGA